MKRFSEQRSAAALVITLAFIFMISTVMLALAVSMRQDRPAANLHLERARADFLAQDGVERVIATLRQMSADPNRNWMTQPGQLVAGAELPLTTDPATMNGSGADPRKILQYIVPLHSGTASATASTPTNALERSLANQPNINIPTLRNNSTYLITDNTVASTGGVATAMPVKWIGVLQDGTLSSVLTATSGSGASVREYIWTDNPDYAARHSQGSLIVGRYAYWMDDESGKINYNLAYGRRTENLNPPSHPSCVDLSVLTAATGFAPDVGKVLQTYITNGGQNNLFFNTPTDARQVEAKTPNTNILPVLQANKFELTHYNHDPNTTFFNNQRIVLTTRPERAGWTYSTTVVNDEGGVGGWIGINKKTWGKGGLPRYLRILGGTEISNRLTGGQVQTANFVPKASPTDLIDPGLNYDINSGGSIDYNRLSQTVAELALRPEYINGVRVATADLPIGYMQRHDWPLVTGTNSTASIQSKYFSGYDDHAGQNGISLQTSRLVALAMNLIEYVRCKESPQPAVWPMLCHYDPTATDLSKMIVLGNSAQTNLYMGATRTPMINEIGVWLGKADHDFTPPGGYLPGGTVSAATAIKTGDYYYEFKVELYLPKHYGVPTFNLSTYYTGCQGSVPYVLTGPDDQYRQITSGQVSNPSNPGTTVMKAGTYVTITQDIAVVSTGPNPAPFIADPTKRPTAASVRITFGGRGNNLLDLAPAISNPNIPVKIDLATVDPNKITSMEVDDPRANKVQRDWDVCPATPIPNTFARYTGDGHDVIGTNVRSTLYKPANPAFSPQQDVDSTGNVTDASLYMPAPAGTSYTADDGVVQDNTNGIVNSVGELGYLSTGIEASPIVSVGNSSSSTSYQTLKSVPWRSLRLQPSKQGTTIVPDWALMDLFTAPVAPADQNNRYVYAPHENAFGGRVNVNTQVQPFTDMKRILPLEAALFNCTRLSGSATKIDFATAQTLAQNIYQHVLASSPSFDPLTYGKLYGSAYNAGYVSPGEVVEIQGIADSGEISEELVRQMGNIVTTRGNVFSVYTVGQSLKETPEGRIVVTGEQRVQAMIERYLDVSDPAKTPIVRFAPVYYRNLIP